MEYLWTSKSGIFWLWKWKKGIFRNAGRSVLAKPATPVQSNPSEEEIFLTEGNLGEIGMIPTKSPWVGDPDPVDPPNHFLNFCLAFDEDDGDSDGDGDDGEWWW